MNNDLYELLRILLYPFGAAGLLYLGIVIHKARIALHSLAAYFLMWTGLLIVMKIAPADYRPIANTISTPVLTMIVLATYYNLWKVRHE